MAVRRHTRRHTSLSEAGVAPLCVYATARVFALPSLHSCVRVFAYAHDATEVLALLLKIAVFCGGYEVGCRGRHEPPLESALRSAI